MEVARAENQRHDEEQADPRVECQADSTPHQGLAEGAAKGEQVTEEVELGHLVRAWQQAADIGPNSVDSNIQPATDGITGRVFPGLQAVAMAKIVCWFPVVERLVAILDRGEESGYGISSQEDVKGRDGLNGEGVLDGSGNVVSCSAPNNFHMSRN